MLLVFVVIIRIFFLMLVNIRKDDDLFEVNEYVKVK